MDGVLVVNKPQGVTSHDVVDFVRKKFGVKKCGHAGTLDPMATGVLILLLGKLTKSSNAYMSSDKEYEAEMVLGAVSDTSDAWGKIKETARSTDLSSKKIKDAFKEFVGETEQVPPMYSAVKLKGRKLYELARKGESVDMPPRKIIIKNIEVLDITLPNISFRVSCSKGTYIRQLCVDIGEKLGCGAYLSRLVRTRSGDFHLDSAAGMDKLKEIRREDLEKMLVKGNR